MDIELTHEKGRVLVTVFHITGAIDSSNYQELDQVATRTIDAGTRFVLVDLSKVHFMSSAALRSLQKMDKKLNALSDGLDTGQLQKGILDGTYKSPYLKLLNPSAPTLLTLKTAGWDMIFDIFKDMKMAVASF
jgi:anti-anti-sigma factor